MAVTSQDTPPPAKATATHKYLVVALAIATLAVAGGASALGWHFTHLQSPSPVPANVRRSVPFPAYYPDQTKLPAGYTLDVSSFSSNGHVVVYSVRHGSEILAVSVQPRPADNQIQNFYKTRLPLNATLTTPLGTATVGAIAGRTIASLPAAKAWILVTAPGDTNQTSLDQVLKAFRSP